MYLTKRSDGLYAPSYDSDLDQSLKVKVGEEVKATRARNVKFHRKAFGLLHMGYQNQDTYDNFEIYRQIVSIKAGFVEWVEGKDGVKYPFAMSVSFEKMNQQKFEDWYSAILTIISKEIKLTTPEIEAELASFF